MYFFLFQLSWIMRILILFFLNFFVDPIYYILLSDLRSTTILTTCLREKNWVNDLPTSTRYPTHSPTRSPTHTSLHSPLHSPTKVTLLLVCPTKVTLLLVCPTKVSLVSLFPGFLVSWFLSQNFFTWSITLTLTPSTYRLTILTLLLTGTTTDPLTHWPTDPLTHWLTDPPTNPLTHWPTDPLTHWPTH